MPNPRPPVITAHCSRCRAKFTYERLGKRLRLYCSPRCARLTYAARGRAKRTHPASLHCQECGVSIDAAGTPRRFCSDACRHRAYNGSEAGRARDQRRRDKRVRRGGIGTSLRQQVFDRDGWKCRRCGCEVQLDRPQTINGAVIRWTPEARRTGNRRVEDGETICRRCCGQLGAIASKAKLNSSHALEGAPSSPAAEFLESPPPILTAEEPRLVLTTDNAPDVASLAIQRIDATRHSHQP
jgi:hypothetical protein